jgi:hypothetical protein
MVERLPARLGRGDGDLQALLDLLLADILRQALGAQVLLDDPLRFPGAARYDPISAVRHVSLILTLPLEQTC